ncbi:hypothetical protein BJ684DRAFT_14420 [Piptocephalis cylindrospora]|uniref:Poly A polymerase head domain-containing protein n=1 Tax=Piptocephalis cylindrospora TaxID=1907219 RepID=A0A4P9Y8G2_9FUNG|nr:hypothetical protein BJ684DRAFT_14420 [Piptocephalis cylindrospora]|eukprot:RKP15325.1 hypothetical protein BJ684DRAFT_14420 [Piptocephalis cylindrospora]
MSSPQGPQLNLTPQEEEVCEVLRQVVHTLSMTQKSDRMNPPLVIRIAGGWVRDKLLGLACHDLDIAASSMTGAELAEAVVQWLEAQGKETRSVGKISVNPERSKHLETATTWVAGLPIDFVHLRNETYGEDSRIPTTVAFGTPEQDAYRRDITINALFYNIHSRQVEDFVGTGLKDLRDHRVRTPLPPIETFMDDPLRILRCIRFTCRFHFALDPATYEAMCLPQVQEALARKISRERIGVEVTKMLRGPGPTEALKLLHRAGLFPIVFEAAGVPIIDPKVSLDTATALYKIIQGSPEDAKVLLGMVGSGDAEGAGSWEETIYLAAALWHLRGQDVSRGKKEISAASVVIKESLKLSNAQADCITGLFLAQTHVEELIQTTGHDRVKLGLAIREMGRHPHVGPAWRLALPLHLAGRMAQGSSEISLEPYLDLLKEIEEQDLSHTYELKYAIDGKAMAKALGIPLGFWIRDILENYVIPWQLARGPLIQDTERDNLGPLCMKWIMEKQEEIKAYAEKAGQKAKEAAVADAERRKKEKQTRKKQHIHD